MTVLRFSFSLSGAVFATYGEKDAGTASRSSGGRTGPRY